MTPSRVKVYQKRYKTWDGRDMHCGVGLNKKQAIAHASLILSDLVERAVPIEEIERMISVGTMYIREEKI